MKLPLVFLVTGALFLACSGKNERACTVGADCASGTCKSDGTCASNANDAGPVDAAGDVASPDDGGDDDAVQNQDAPVTGCVPNHDGTITRDEVLLGPGLHASYLTATKVPVNTSGTTGNDGARAWDFTTSLAGDHALVVQTVAVPGQWFDSQFSGATYTARLSDTADLLGVFETTPGAILLRGEVSPSNGGAFTELVYSAGVPSLSFPMAVGTTWESSVTVTGQAEGVPLGLGYTEAYSAVVDAAGSAKTPFATFDVLRVKVSLVRTIGIQQTKSHTFIFVSECVGPVATIVSQDNESKDEFTTAAEIQRLSP